MSDDPEVGELLALVDKLEALLESSDLSEIEVEAAGTTLVLRKPVAALPVPSRSGGGDGAADGYAAGGAASSSDGAAAGSARAGMGLHAVVAPLTGVFYLAPSPGAVPYVKVGGTVSAGQVIGLIEAMKLFNEIKSDVNGTVRRIAAETGSLVKAKQPLIEVEPS
jgi:acetyl-CoA carboxylase biotin carboxyl carrier protein